MNENRKLLKVISDGNVIINDESNLDKITQMISDYFLLHGLQPDSEPNGLGLELENLYSKFIRKL